jgi:hypothetical protein
MTDRHTGYVVALARDGDTGAIVSAIAEIKGADARAVIAAIGMIKGVVSVEPAPSDIEMRIARGRCSDQHTWS